MNKTAKIFRIARISLAPLAAIFLIPQLHAQDIQTRFLLIFDTSQDMKSRLKDEQLEINQLLATSMAGQLHDGDSIGVWTFDQALHAGQFPLVTWVPENARQVAENLNKFVRQQHYSGTGRLAALQPVLNEVIQHSPRLTVIIFCDGEDKLNWTPYSDGINRLFQERQDELKRARQPFILLLRLQLGQYVGCTVNFPPGMLNFPDFPPFPLPPQPKPAAAPPAPMPAPRTAPPLIIVGTNIMSQEPGPSPGLSGLSPAKPMVLANVPPARPVKPTIVPPEMATSPAKSSAASSNAAPSVLSAAQPAAPTNAISPANAVASTKAIPSTNAVASIKIIAPPVNPHFSRIGALVAGAALFVVALALTALTVFRRRADHTSLISRSMRKD